MTFPYDAYLSFHGTQLIHVPCDVVGEVITHDGESDPFFFTEGVWIEGKYFRRSGPHPLTMWEMIVAQVVQMIEADQGFLRTVLDVDEDDGADAVREFRMAEAAE